MTYFRRVGIALALVASAGLLTARSPSSLHAESVIVTGGVAGPAAGRDVSAAASAATTTPIKHLVVIFQENVSFDHYFATYPHATNPPGETPFTPAPNTPTVIGLSDTLLTHNPNSVQPFRLDPTRSLTCSQDHKYTNEQKAFDNGLMDKFVQFTQGKAGNTRQYCPNGVVMGYFDGNTVTGLWNYAQHYAMNDNSFNTVFGPSTPGALNLISGETAGAACGTVDVFNAPAPCSPTTSIPTTLPLTASGTVVGDPDQYYDDASSGGYGSKNTTAMVGRNVGDLLNGAGLTWGWFNGGFDSPNTKHNLVAVDRLTGIDPAADTTTMTTDYSAHHQPFQYYASTSNPHHLTPSSTAVIGSAADQANHQYDLTDFWATADAGNLPAVSYLKAPKYQDGHAGNSDPLDEQQFLVETINHLQSLPSWSSTAIVIGYDDSDGWYDHVMSPIINHSNTPLDVGCGSASTGSPARCGYGPRLPYLVISPFARSNFVDHTLTDQTSTLRFIEDNWLGSQRINAESFDNMAGSIGNMFDFSSKPKDGHRLYLNPQTDSVIPQGNTGFTVTFSSAVPGQGSVYFGTGPGCAGLVSVATQDQGAGSTQHTVFVTGNDLPGTVGNIGIIPGITYHFEVVTTSSAGQVIDNNGGQCYTVTVPQT